MKPKSGKPKQTIWIVVIVFILIAAASFFGLGTMRSAMRIGYTGHDGWRSWSASYIRLDGSMKHTIHPKNAPDVLCVEVVTEDGSISMEIKDADGNVLLSESDMGTASFEVEVSGKAIVSITADGHKGSFHIE